MPARGKKSSVATLAAIARALNARNAKGLSLPPLLFLTDEKRTPDPLAVARKLPRGSGVILRHYGARNRPQRAKALARIARRRGLVLIVAGDATLAKRVGAQGVHFPGRELKKIAALRRKNPRLLVTASAHGATALAHAAKSGANAALLAPVFRTKSHPGRKALGAKRFNALARAAKLPVYALGGIGAANAKRLARSRACGIAAIGALISGKDRPR